MPLLKTEAIILHALPYGEADKIVTLYTREFGKIKGIAKNARRSRKRFGNTLEICSHVLATFFEKETSSLIRLDHCDLVHDFPGLREDIFKLAWASYFIELVNEMTAEKIRNPELFKLAMIFLTLTNLELPRDELKRIFEIRLLSLLGYEPQFHHCTRCQKVLMEEKLFFGLREGGVLCPPCSSHLPGLVPISMGTVKTLQLAQTIPLEKITRISFSTQGLRESEAVLSRFLQQYLGKDLKAKKFLEQIGSMATRSG
jgi:DNA repair protein RecO (recombination protein O)